MITKFEAAGLLPGFAMDEISGLNTTTSHHEQRDSHNWQVEVI
jgi:hypothetical protein